MSDPYDDGRELARLFGRFEHALKRTGFLKNRSDAQADWDAFAKALGPTFFADVVNAGVAATLVGDPPRKLMSEGLTWQPEHPTPLANVHQLIVQGVCRVRNSYVHGEKFQGGSETWARDATLVGEALAVLREAQGRVPAVSALLA
ncbi:hypothetical protein EN858_22630 [Mesorhizobium sp. M4B.F.Ca.ET.215.01.1.1]|uniref:hypothetical protein n=1 Tax=unclassified Mesorhizobium TaxID=325217 RepID=UPI000FD391CA|nr:MULTISPECIES: hypothetical protein [unclassified Mesorhizobium]RUW21857.1 hypothetical protein EOA34_23175 [Mesorhizobium sp. M4B.F.Ca.ET.013.02.1.1]TGQ08519.1 hypothetical protein EN858_22630 [Mesorhizobium sp. M4B.F.Ca.ET.215.01.1.1]TGQ40904.1 hypothetical protein EN863_020975 [Mesorhizobium sp. M00.F.Ca.ET.220.01.1.1]TGR02075.1 hypothetical protein EN846_19490 [Mesorhizobium sp. M4B.F.Ca.ET.203.01.1.1]TGT45266.1 hypothetical protein EN812_08940 [Mesorhizobium sp. M4B.F.Ca.ET.169.01.1.1]